MHKAAKDGFNQLNLVKIPTVKELNAEYAQVLESKKEAYATYRKKREEMQEYLVARKIVTVLLDKENEVEETQKKTPYISI